VPESERRASEARRFARYLAGDELDHLGCAHYVRWHESGASRGDRVDRMLLSWASIGRPGLALADAYSARLRRDALLRKKLVVVLALLETSSRGVELDRPLSGGPVGFWARMALRGVIAGLVTLLAFVLIGPCHLVCAARGRGEAHG